MSDFLTKLLSLLQPEHNLRVIYLGVMALGMASGVLGCFLLFRKRSLLSDTIGHATLPGVAGGFLLSATLTQQGGKNIYFLVTGALIFGWLSLQTVQYMMRRTRLKQDAALAVSLTGFYALGIVLLSVVQSSGLPQSSGLEYYLYGMVASMVESEAWILAGVSALSIGLVCLFLKELNALSFDEAFTKTQGLPHRWLDEGLMLLSLIVAIVGLQTVGLLLVMALFIVPPATARLWTQSLTKTLWIAGGLGALASLCGAMISASVPNLPAGASIILCSTLLFFLSLLIGRKKGVLTKYVRFYQMEKRLEEGQYLRAVFDSLEAQQQVRLFCGLDFSKKLALTEFSISEVLRRRSWSEAKQCKLSKRLEQKGALKKTTAGKASLTLQGLDQAIEIAKTHRLTEMYLLEHAEVAPKKVHQYVESIEEITTPEIAKDLRSLFQRELDEHLIPPEPHELR